MELRLFSLTLEDRSISYFLADEEEEVIRLAYSLGVIRKLSDSMHISVISDPETFGEGITELFNKGYRGRVVLRISRKRNGILVWVPIVKNFRRWS